MPTPTPFQGRIQVLRKHLSLSQEELASRLGVSFATVNRWEAGKSKPQRAQVSALEKLWDEVRLESEATSSDAASRGAVRRRRGPQRGAVLDNKSMEQMLWDAACSIRG